MKKTLLIFASLLSLFVMISCHKDDSDPTPGKQPNNDNRPPVAVNDTIIVQSGGFSYFYPMINDYDPDGDDLSVYCNDGTYGTVQKIDDKTFIYQPELGYTGPDTVYYNLSDTYSFVVGKVVITVM